MTNARDEEQAMLDTCQQIAAGNDLNIMSDAQTNVINVAAMLCRSTNASASRLSHAAAVIQFEQHPQKQISTQEVLQCGWFIRVPRFRSMLDRHPFISN